jgi:hypothetical protein
MQSRINPILFIPILVVLLFLSIGFINYYYVKKIDRSYSEIINALLKGDNTIHEVTKNSTKTILEIGKIISATNEHERLEKINNLNGYIEHNNTNFIILDSLCTDDFRKKNLGKLVKSRNTFLGYKDSLLSMIARDGVNENTKKFYREEVKEKLDNYLDQQMLYAQNAKFYLLENSGALTTLSERISSITFGLIFAPFIFIIISILYVIIVLYRGSINEND